MDKFFLQFNYVQTEEVKQNCFGKPVIQDEIDYLIIFTIFITGVMSCATNNEF
jgi:hypothetical protein